MMECLKDKLYEGVILDGRFEPVSPLNHGSFGMVFMAKDLVTNEYVAIKCLTKKSAAGESDSPFAIDEQSEELVCHARLGSHPHIVNLIHSFETDAHIYIVLEFCSRGDLYEAIRTGTGPLETEHVRQFMLQLVDAVAYIHSMGMYHRDIKPENIFLNEAGEMKLGDFGLATSEPWSYETTVGSDRYMSPEQYDSAQAGYAPEKADIWAVGICLLNILFSRNPFTTPTESDPLFLDFSRDKQSLFDVFPTMSQDTFEVISHCMSLDPRKRDLESVRAALERAISFTTFDESLDDFCGSERPVMASANREPLRTPSIQSPQVDTGSFPWAKALHASPPQTFRQLSVIPDTEIYSEDLFPSSEESNKDWFSVGQQTPSLASMLDSSLGASMKSMAIRRPMKTGPPKAHHAPVSGSLPITMSRPRPLPSMSSVFGKKIDTISKSWSDLWDEEVEEEEEEEAEKQLKARQMQNARTYSHESASGDVTLRGPLEPHSASFVNIGMPATEATYPKVKDIDMDLVADGFFFHDTPANASQHSPPRYSPPPKRTTFDKWSALGDRRRAYSGTQTMEPERSPDLWKSKRNVGLGFVGFGTGVWDNKAHIMIKDKGTSPRGRDRPTQLPRKYSRGHVGDLEWVSGWGDLHL